MSTTQHAARTRDDVRRELAGAICGAMSGLTVIKALAGASISGMGDIDAPALDWLAGKAMEDADAAFNLAEEFERITRPPQTPEQQKRGEEAVARLIRERAEAARREVEGWERSESLLETGGVAAVIAEADRGCARIAAELAADTD